MPALWAVLLAQARHGGCAGLAQTWILSCRAKFESCRCVPGLVPPNGPAQYGHVYTRPTQTVLRGVIRVKHLRVFESSIFLCVANAPAPSSPAPQPGTVPAPPCASGPPPSASAWYRASAACASVLRLGLRPPRLRLATLPCTARRPSGGTDPSFRPALQGPAPVRPEYQQISSRGTYIYYIEK
jgi:hypothetical protein